MSVSGFSAGVAGADIAMLVTPEGGIALQSNMVENNRGRTILEFPTLQGTRLLDSETVLGQTTVYYNDTGVAQDFTLSQRVAAKVAKPLVVKVGVQ
jgi:hypothetical protein